MAPIFLSPRSSSKFADLRVTLINVISRKLRLDEFGEVANRRVLAAGRCLSRWHYHGGAFAYLTRYPQIALKGLHRDLLG